MKNIIIAVTLLLFTSIASANGVYETGKIVRIVPSGSNFISVWLDGADDNSLCEGNGRWTIQTANDPLHEQKYSKLLAAATTGATVRLFHLETSGCGNWDSNRIFHVDLRFDGSLE